MLNSKYLTIALHPPIATNSPFDKSGLLSVESPLEAVLRSKWL